MSTEPVFKTNGRQVYLMNYHIVFCPCRRKSILTGDVAKCLEQTIADIATDKDVDIISLAVMPDHVHIFVSTYPQLPIHEFIQHIKGTTAHALRTRFPELKKIPSMWTRSYFISTAGVMSSVTIQSYIEDQRIR